MATLPTPEQTARKILVIFVTHFKSRPGEVLLVQNFMAILLKQGLRTEDIQSGIQYATKQGWVEVLPEGAKFKLTQAGFDQA